MKKKFLLFVFLTLILAPVFAEPKYTFSCESRSVVLRKDYSIERRDVTIARNGGKWVLEIPSYQEVKNLDDPVFTETDDGFSLGFYWGGGRFYWTEIFFFKEIEGEPCLYKIDSTVSKLTYDHDKGEFDCESETKNRPIQPPIKISELTIDKIKGLLGGKGYQTRINSILREAITTGNY